MNILKRVVRKTSITAITITILISSSFFAFSTNINFIFSEKLSHESNQEKLYEQKIEDIVKLGHSFIGKPYRFKGPENAIFDCSGYISFIFKKNEFELPRTSAQIGTFVNKINIQDIQKGDLLFFKGRNTSSGAIGHVSLVTQIDGEEIEMLHSCRRGVIKEIYNYNSYYTQRLLFAGRHPNAHQFDNYIPPYKTNIDDTIKINLDSIKTILDSTNITTDEIRIMGVGDIMIGTNFPNKSHLPPNDGKDILAPVTPLLSQADIAFGNLEGVFLTENGPVKKCSNPKVCYAFKMPDYYVQYIKDAGLNLLSVANNHVGDFGDVGRKNTQRVLSEAEIPHAGMLDCPFTIFMKDSIKYGFAAFAPNYGTVSINDIPNAVKIVAHLDSMCDIVIVSFHGGAEGATKNRITRQNEIFLGENRGNPYKFARAVIDAGADVVFGHGPHVVRAIDSYKGRFIAYSMGNFATYSRFNLSGPKGYAPIIDIKVNKNGEFLRGQIHAFKQVGEGGPIEDENLRAIKEIMRLTKLDIPETQLEIFESGEITIKP
jgi:hypothetical protein